jgi:DNA-binding HxlR family transcriptional regulator
MMQVIRLRDASFLAPPPKLQQTRGMLGRTYPGQDCALARALEMIGERWTMLIIRDARLRGAKRFGEFQKSLGIATNVLAKRLDHLVEQGLMSLDAATGEYRLTESGNDLLIVAIAATEWGERWIAKGPIKFVDSSSEQSVTAALIDKATGERVQNAAVESRPRD